MVVFDACSRILGRLRCLSDCAESLLNGKPFPECVCYVPGDIEFKPKKPFTLCIYAKPDISSLKTEILCTSKHRIFLFGFNDNSITGGRWVKIKTLFDSGALVKFDSALEWILFSENDLIKANVSDSETADSWKLVVDYTYMLNPLAKKGINVLPMDETAVEQMLGIPINWSLSHDQALVNFLHKEVWKWTAKDFVDSVENSENCGDASRLLQDHGSFAWYAYSEVSDLTLTMKDETVIRSLTICFTDEQNLDNPPPIPSIVSLYGGVKGLEEMLLSYELNSTDLVNGSIRMILEESKHVPILKLEFKGYGICISHLQFEGTINALEEHEYFSSLNAAVKAQESEHLIASFEQDFVQSRTVLLHRTAELLDSVLAYVVPFWEFSSGSFGCMKVLQNLMPISKLRKNLIKDVLQRTVSHKDGETPFLYIKRNYLSAIKSHKDTVFSQIYDGMMREEARRGKSSFDFRFAQNVTQWWKCAFIGEGIIDHGGGFRDTLSDISEELCPSEADSQLLLPFFIPCANQQNGIANNYRDAYIPNPSCMEFQKYEWIGKLMGACIRSNERLSMTLSPFFWKMLAESEPTWVDYMSVDETEVKTLIEMEKMDEAAYMDYFGEMRTWTVVLSDGTSLLIKPNGDNQTVSYGDRLDYIQLVKKGRMTESMHQVAAIRKGLLQVIPKVLLWLFTSFELEMKVCSTPEILFEDLKKHVIINDLSFKESQTVKYLWNVLEDFSSTDRSHFLRFATGRRRLPTDVYVSERSETDVLPTSSTCGHEFYLPKYTSLKKADELIRLAIYSCKLIDTDTEVLQ